LSRKIVCFRSGLAASKPVTSTPLIIFCMGKQERNINRMRTRPGGFETRQFCFWSKRGF
jgi:hypothetical protein